MVGNPWKGTYHVAIDITNYGDADRILSELRALGVSARVNVGSNDRIAIYDLTSLQKLLEFGESLEERTRKRLQTLVRARGPVPEWVLHKIQGYVAMGWSMGRIAASLNEQRVAAGMGGRGWTAKKVQAVWDEKVPRRLRNREAA
jgi:hypothetical protein